MTIPVQTGAPAFPVSWSDPAEDAYTYFFDPMHFPRPISPLFASMLQPAYEYGFTLAAKDLNAPLLGAKVTIQNGFYFNAIIPEVPANEVEAKAQAERVEATLRVEIARMLERWRIEHLPAITARAGRLAEIDLAAAPREDVSALLDEVLTIWCENWATHFRIAIPMLVAMQLYDDFYLDLFGGDEHDAHTLLTGAASESVKAGIGLSDLARAAKAAGLDRALLAMRPEEAMSRLETLAMGPYFAAAVRDYLREYGLRQDLFELATPTWQEDPSIAISTIQTYLRTGHDASASHAAAVARAEGALAEARTRLDGYPEAVRGQFEAMVQAARDASFLQEEHNFYIDQRMLAQTRVLFLKLGRRLADEEIIAAAEDVFMLSLEDLKAVASVPVESVEVCELVLRRREEFAQAATLTPPPFVGQPPSGPPSAQTAVDRALIRFFGGPPQPAAAPNQLRGNPGSRGTVSGIARVVQTLGEARALQPGEILVTISTMPAWTPFFGVAAAVVTETGGSLSHCAIVAREYGIPAVVGAVGATRVIQTGQQITVDGATGIITIDR